jgi:hypothetical protein
MVSQFKNFTLGPLSFDGEVKGNGVLSPRFSGRLSTPNFWVNGWGAGAVSGDLAFDGKRWEFSRVTAGQGATGRWTYDKAEGRWSGQLDLQGVPMEEWAPRLGLVPAVFHTGTLHGSLSAEGSQKDARSRFKARWRGARWEEIPFEAEAEGAWQEGLWRFKTLKASLPDGGTVAGEGVLSQGGAERNVDAAFDVRQFPFHRFLQALGVRSPGLGTFQGRVLCQGPLNDLSVDGDISGEDLPLADQGPGKWNGKFHFKDRQIQIREFQVKTREGLWRLKEGSQIFFLGQGDVRMQLINDLRNIALGPLHFFGGLEVVGQWKSLPEPALECHLRAQSLWINQQFFDRDLARATWSKNKITFTQVPGGVQNLSGAVRLDHWPQVRLENLTLWENTKRRLLIQGEVGPGLWDFDLEGWGLPAGTLMGLADMDWPVEGRWDVYARGRGSAADPRVEGEILGREGKLLSVPYDRLEASVLWEGPLLKIKSIEAARKDGYLIRGEGQFPLDQEEESRYSLLFRLTNGNLAVLKDIWPDCRWAKGDFLGELQILPGQDGPRTTGFLQLQNAQVHAQRYFRQLSDLQARLTLKNNRVIFENVTGKIGRGRLAVKGDLGVQGLRVADYNLSIESVGARGIGIRVPQLSVPPGPFLKKFSFLGESLEGVSEGEPAVSVKVTGPAPHPRIHGTLVLQNTRFTYPPSKNIFVKGRRSFLGELWTEADWDITFKTGNKTWYRNEYVNALVGGSLRFQRRPAFLAVEGRMRSNEGFITYLGKTFRIKRALFEVVTDTRTVADQEIITPYLSCEAEMTITTLDTLGASTQDTITMIVERAPIGKIEPRFVSRNRPGLNSERVAEIALGFAQDEDQPQQLTPLEREQLLKGGLVQLLGSAAAPVANKVGREIGLDYIFPFYQPPSNTETASALPGSAAQPGRPGGLIQGMGVTTGLQLTRNISGVYRARAEEAQNQFYFRDELEINYRILGSLFLRASTELDTEKLLGQPPNRQAVLENQWRFGLPKKRARQTPPETAASSDAGESQGESEAR